MPMFASSWANRYSLIFLDAAPLGFQFSACVSRTRSVEGTSLQTAFRRAFELDQIEPSMEVDGSLKQFFVFENRKEFHDTTGVGDLPLEMGIEGTVAEPVVEADEDVDPVELIFREEVPPSGIQMAMF